MTHNQEWTSPNNAGSGHVQTGQLSPSTVTSNTDLSVHFGLCKPGGCFHIVTSQDTGTMKRKVFNLVEGKRGYRLVDTRTGAALRRRDQTLYFDSLFIAEGYLVYNDIDARIEKMIQLDGRITLLPSALKKEGSNQPNHKEEGP